MAGAPPPRPLVSAILIFLNGRRFLGEAIESVLAQRYGEWELLLVDDGSTDGASDIAREYAERHAGRIRYLEHAGHRNLGMSASRNAGLREARGHFVALLDADDVWLPEKLATQVALMAEQPAAQMTFGPTRFWFGWTGSSADAARDSIRALRAPPGLHRPPGMLRLFLAGRALTPATCSVLIRRDALAATGGFEERFTGLYEDQAFFVKAFLKLACYVTTDVLDLYRQHDTSHMADAVRTNRYSHTGPTRAMFELYAWCARYLLRERVTDLGLWRQVGARLWDLRRFRSRR
ncbi:MAG TPA: glycosyltransferase family 2 protein [Gemmatimonadaceae bacterium]|nr:glycosyltransferase family 2 protein [Gemmatimonadaceae bacterium]